MDNRISYAVDLLTQKSATCIILKSKDMYLESHKRGIAPLMEQLRENKNAFHNCVIADKVIGKAAAMMCVLGHADAVHGTVMSMGAKQILDAHQITYSYDRLVPFIENRTKTGSCPMEAAVKDIFNLEEAFETIEKTLESLKRQE